MKKSNMLIYAIALAIIFTFANFTSAQTQREAQLGTLCKRFRDYNDCKEYLKDYPNGNSADFAKSVVSNYEANSNTTKQTVEDQYWDAVKNSTNADDYKTYLKVYPNGKYSSIARLKSGQSPTSTNSFFAFKASNPMTNKAFMESWENHLKPQMPMRFGEDEIYRGNAPTKVENYFYFGVRTPNLSNVNIRTQSEALKTRFLADYCNSEAYQRKITVVLGYRDATSTYSQHLAPNDCSANKTSDKQTDAEYLNDWAAEVRVDLPEMIGDFQLTDAKSKCPVGCNEVANSNHLSLTFNAPNDQRDAPIDQLKASLTPLLSEVYCASDAIARNISLGIYFKNRGEKADFLNTWINPQDCTAKPTVIQTNTVFITSIAYDGNLGGVAGANATCQMHAKRAGLNGTYKAWIGGASDNRPITPRLTFNQSTIPYLMPNKTQIATNWQALLSSNLIAKLDVDEYGKTHLNGSAWTGMSEGRVIDSCNNWTSNDSSKTGAHGCSSTKDARWGRDNCGVNRCDLKYRLYCFQQ